LEPISGDVCTTPSNGCGNGSQGCKAVSITPLPTQPSDIHGETNPIIHETYDYRVDIDENADNYIWNLTGGSLVSDFNNASVTWMDAGSQQLTVKTENECGEK